MVYCFFSAQYLPTPGGVEQYTNNIARELIGRGHQVKIVTSALPRLPAHEITGEGIEIFRLDSLLLMNGRFPIVKPFGDFKELINTALQNVDHAIIQTRFYPLSFFAAKECVKRRIPFLVIEHGAAHLNMGNPVLNVLGQWYEHFITLLLRKKTKDFFAVSEAGAQWLSHFHIKAKGVFYNAIDPVRIESAQTFTEEIASRYGLSHGRKTVVFSGRLVPEKGIIQLIEAVKNLQESFAPMLFIAGDGPLQAELPEADWMIKLGRISQSDVFALLKKCDVFCLPSESEGMSTAVLEAGACGCYIITTDRGGSKELVSSAEYGTILKENSSACIEEALREAFSNDQQRQEKAENAKEKVLRCFTFQATCDALENFLKNQKI